MNLAYGHAIHANLVSAIDACDDISRAVQNTTDPQCDASTVDAIVASVQQELAQSLDQMDAYLADADAVDIPAASQADSYRHCALYITLGLVALLVLVAVVSTLAHTRKCVYVLLAWVLCVVWVLCSSAFALSVATSDGCDDWQRATLQVVNATRAVPLDATTRQIIEYYVS